MNPRRLKKKRYSSFCFVCLILILTSCQADKPIDKPTKDFPTDTVEAAPTLTKTPTMAQNTPTADIADETKEGIIITKETVSVGKYRMFIHCIGQGSPVVIFEAGWGDVSDTWSEVQSSIGEVTMACSYDRVGVGRSSPEDAPMLVDTIVNQLHTLLTKAGIDGPLILVGHSWGGVLTRFYTDLYTEDVVGLVLLDSSHPDMFRRNLSILPPESPDEHERITFYRDWFSSSLTDPTLKVDLDLFDAGALGDLPLIVITALDKPCPDGFPMDIWEKYQNNWIELQTELANLSTDSTHVLLEDSSHFIQHDRPDVVIEMVLGLVGKTK